MESTFCHNKLLTRKVHSMFRVPFVADGKILWTPTQGPLRNECCRFFDIIIDGVLISCDSHPQVLKKSGILAAILSETRLHTFWDLMQACGGEHAMPLLFSEQSPPCVRFKTLPVEFPKSPDYHCCASRSTNVFRTDSKAVVSIAQKATVQDYMNSCSIQDCAFIVSLQRGESEDRLECQGVNYIYRIGIIDVDPKR